MRDVIHVAVVNDSTLTEHEVESGTMALQRQVTDDFLPAWGVDASLRIVPRDRAEKPHPGFRGLVLLDGLPEDPERQQINATSGGQPLAQLSLNDASGAGQDWTHLASQKLLQMLVDSLSLGPAYRQAKNRHDVYHYLYARDVCAPCADYGDGYAREGWWVSDFVLPAWFDGDAFGRDAAFDRCGSIHEPYEVLKGGQARVYDLSGDAPGWVIVDHEEDHRRPVVANGHRARHAANPFRVKCLRTEEGIWGGG